MKSSKLLTVALCGLLGAFALTGCGSEATDEASDATAENVAAVTIYGDVQLDGEYNSVGDIIVEPTLAEDFGLADSVDPTEGVSALDALVAMSQLWFPDMTADNVGEYITFEDGLLQKAFGLETINWAFILNNRGAASDEMNEDGSYTALTLDQTILEDDDILQFATYQDTTNYSDLCLWITGDDSQWEYLTITAGEETTLNYQGYNFVMYSALDYDGIIENLQPVEGVQLGLLQDDGSIEDIDGAVTDSEGNVTFSVDEPGEYTLIVYLPADKGYAFYKASFLTVE